MVCLQAGFSGKARGASFAVVKGVPDAAQANGFAKPVVLAVPESLLTGALKLIESSRSKGKVTAAKAIRV